MIYHHRTTTLATNSNLKRVNHFYKYHKQNVSCHLQDQIAITENEMGMILGTAFIRCYAEYNLMRSLLVAPNCRRQGIATELVTALLTSVDTDVYLTCRSEFIEFYRKFNFVVRQNNNECLPNIILKEHKKGLTIMYRPCC